MILLNGKEITNTTFPDGTPLIRIGYDIKQGANTITWKYDDDSEFLKVAYISKKLRESYPKSLLLLDMPYIPNARMDRTKNNDEVFTLKYFAEMLNDLYFDNVYCLDPHSYVSEALINGIISGSPMPYINEAINIVGSVNTVLFFPDEGAMKRYSSIASAFNLPYVFGMKRRDWRTGEILGLDVLGDVDELEDKNVLIVDDICSKGGTFYHSAKALKQYNVNNIYLYVSHCENAMRDGDMIKSGLIKHVFTTDSIYRHVGTWNTSDGITLNDYELVTVFES